MKIQRRKLLLILLITIFISILYIIYPSSVNAQEANFTIYSSGAVLLESSTGKMLYGKNENEKLYPASTTKILTAILAIENCNLSDKITASNTAITAIPSGYSNAAIQPGETLTVQELLELFLVHSANEVGYILAEHISENVENFATLMNKKASELGCKYTQILL